MNSQAGVVLVARQMVANEGLPTLMGFTLIVSLYIANPGA